MCSEDSNEASFLGAVLPPLQDENSLLTPAPTLDPSHTVGPRANSLTSPLFFKVLKTPDDANVLITMYPVLLAGAEVKQPEMPSAKNYLFPIPEQQRKQGLFGWVCLP